MQRTVIVLIFNSEHTLDATLASARRVSDEIFVVDSQSKDGTVELARLLGATMAEHPFENYGAQRNWAIDNLPISRPWQIASGCRRMDERSIGGGHSGPAR